MAEDGARRDDGGTVGVAADGGVPPGDAGSDGGADVRPVDAAPVIPRGAPVLAYAVLLFLLAVLLGRFVLVGTWGWGLFALLVPLLVVLLAWRAGLAAALLLVVFFTGTALVARWLLTRPGGWIALVLLPLLAFTFVLAWRVLQQMRADAAAKSR